MRRTSWCLWGVLGLLATALVMWARPSTAAAQPKVGGHLGVAIPLVLFTNDANGGTQGIGADFVTFGLAPGVTVHLDEHWAFDFEFITFSTVDEENIDTFFVLDPGVVYKWGVVNTGLRLAMQVGGGINANVGLVPIINKGFDLGLVNVFVELDLPLFFFDEQVAFSLMPQFGVSF